MSLQDPHSTKHSHAFGNHTINPFTGVEVPATNQDFLKDMFGAEWERSLIAYFPDTEDAKWGCKSASSCAYAKPSDNVYFVISIFENGIRQINAFEAQYVVVIDDVGTKIVKEVAERVLPEPTYKLETSPGNEQWGYKLSIPNRDPRIYDAIVERIKNFKELNPFEDRQAEGKKKNGADPGMSGVNRYMRLPYGANNKPIYREFTGKERFHHVLHSYDLDNQYNIEEIADALDADISEEALEAVGAKYSVRSTALATQDEMDSDFVWKVLKARNMVYAQRPSPLGFYAIECPWQHEHTPGVGFDTGTAYKPGENGGFQCHHGHCIDRTKVDLLDWVETVRTPDEIASHALTLFEPIPEDQQTPKVTEDTPLPDLRGGSYSEIFLLREISLRFSRVDRNGEVAYVHKNSDGEHHAMKLKSFEEYLSNIYVEVPPATEDEKPKLIPAAKWWRMHPKNPGIKKAVFKATKNIRPDEYNYWRGWGVEEVEGTNKIRRFLKHIYTKMAKKDLIKYHYIINWMAWTVQNPELNAETVMVFKGEGEGSGKTTVSEALRVIFGAHATTLSDPEQLLGSHAGEILEYKCFVQIEEALFAGDPRVADKAKHNITGTTRRVNPKGFREYDVPNRMSAIITTNHHWAVNAGVNARRWFVCEVDESATEDFDYFKKLYDDLYSGGHGQLLRALRARDLSDWHPRLLPRTEELAEQQLLSAGTIEQWLLVAAENDAIPGYTGLKYDKFYNKELDKSYTTADLFGWYLSHVRSIGKRIDYTSSNAFGKRLTKILGARYKKLVWKDKDEDNHNESRLKGFIIPPAEDLIECVEKALGITKSSEAVHFPRRKKQTKGD